MKNNLHITIYIRNNQILQRRKDLNMSQVEFAKVAGIGIGSFQALENCLESPLDKSGNWTEQAMKLCNFFCEEPEVIFSEDVVSLKKNKIVAAINANTLIAAAQEKMLLEAGVQKLENAEVYSSVKNALLTLTPREEKVVRMRFGIGEESSHSFEEVGQEFNVNHRRIQQIELKALRKLRHPDNKKLFDT